ncbi:MAG TPA: antitoxin VapB family protein [Candidatus Thermoplasmatota archaeon]|nr:antitoxin VapB family protein [Candidatus Thermoplasmatota archaeon]
MSKVVQLSDDAYARLKASKRTGESFSDVVVRAFPKGSLMEMAGAASASEVKGEERRRRAIDAASAERDDRLARRRKGA